MPDYVYLLENRLSLDQRNALSKLRGAARDAGMILFLTGDAVRDLTSGHAVHDLEIAVHGNALKLKKPLEKLGGKVWGEDEFSHSLYLCFPGTVRVDVVSTHRVEYPKPGKAVIHPASIQEDLRRRDFTVNAMAISLNEGSFGLLMDPLNGAADIEARALRLVSNYGFLEDPSLQIRATRYRARLGWDLDPRTQARYENAKAEGVIEHLPAHARSRELEQIGHEEEGLKVLRALESEGWMNVLCPAWTSAKADEAKLNALHDLAVELLMQGVHADTSAAQMQLLTAGLGSKDLSSLKKLMLRPGFVAEWNGLDALAAGFQRVLLAKQNQTPSAAYRLLTSYDPEAILWLGFTGKAAAVQERFHQFLKVWPEARQRIPYAMMQEMRITPELPGYNDLVQQIFLELIDGKLTTPEEMAAFLEPHSPPAPPPQATVKRPRGRREKLKQVFEDEEEETAAGDEDQDEMGGDEEELELGVGSKGDVEDEEAEAEEGDEEEEEAAPVVKGAGKNALAAAKGSGKNAAAAPAASAARKEQTAGKVEKTDGRAGEPAGKAETTPAVKPAKAAHAPVHAPVKAPVKAPAHASAHAPVKAPVKAKVAPPAAKARPQAPLKKASPVAIAGKGGKPASKSAAAATARNSHHGKPVKTAPAQGKKSAGTNHKAGGNSRPAKAAKPAAKKAPHKSAPQKPTSQKSAPQKLTSHKSAPHKSAKRH